MKFNVTEVEFDFDDDYAEESKLTFDEEIDIQLESERVYRKRYEDFQEWLNQCPLVVTDYQDYTDEFTITFNLKAD